MSTSSAPVLPDEVIRRITEEERLRASLKVQLEKDRTKEDEPRSTIWKFLNSSFGLLLFTTVVVTGLGGLFTVVSQHVKDRQNLYQQEKKLLAEYDFRLNQIDSFMTVIPQLKDEDNQGGFIQYVQRIANGDATFQPGLPEYRQVHMAALVIQLDSLGISDNATQAIAATENLSNGYVVKDGKDLRTPAGFRYLPLDYFPSRLEALHQFSESARRKIESDGDPRRPLWRRVIADLW